MRSVRQVCAITLCAAALLFASQANAQKSQVRSRVIGPVDETRTVKTSGNVHPLARTEYDQGALGDSQPMTRMLILLQRGDDQEASLRQLLEDQQTAGSANYHKWLTPAQFGTQFGPSDADVQAVTDWLTRQGFQVAKVSAGRTTVEFSGSAAQVRTAFQTEIHQFSANGKNFIANVSEPSIPAALAPVVRGVVALHNYPKEAHVRNVGQYRRIKATGELKPLFTYGTPANYALAPADFATIYSVPAGADGTGQAIAVVGQSNINVQDIIDFRNLFGLPQNFSLANIILNGPDPGIVAGDEGESDLDIEWAGALAPNANILFVTSQSTESNPSQVTAGVDLSALYVIDNNLAGVISESYGGCEFNNGTLGNAFYNQIWQQAAAQGITVAVSAGDNGSAGCDNPNTATAASGGLAVNGVASTPYNVAVGGTDFNPSTTTTQYWSATNTTTTQGSALSYIPEVTWNDSTCATNYPTACTSVDPTGGDLTAASGGPSNCAVLTSNGASCSASGGYTKPAFQTGSGFGSFLSASTNRVLPDVSFFASNGQNGVAVIVCQADSSPQNGATCSLGSTTDFSLVGGTSVSTPAFAAVMAMVNQKTGQRQGNANYVLYGLAANDTNYVGGKCNGSIPGTPPASTCVFNDVVEAANTNGVEWNNTVACAGGSLNCSNTGTGFGVLVSGSTAAFVANTGYDAATGLGSINVTNLLKAWGTFSRTPTITTLTSQSTSPGISGQNFTFTVTVTPAPPTTSSETISLIANTANGQVAIGAGTNGQPFALATNGTVTATTNLLPPGTTSIVARYGGDATHAASMSNPPLPFVANGSNQASKTTINFVTFDSNNNPVLSASSPQTATYGSPYILQIAVTSPTTSNKPCAPSGGTSTFPTPTFPCPTGKIKMTDNNSPLNDFPKGPTSNATDTATLNNVGIAEDQPIQLPAGSHSIVASYAGDPNYQASTSSAMALTITPASTTTNVTTSMSTITAGATVQLTANIGTTSNGEAPCGITNGGTVAFTSNGTALSGTVAYTAIASTTTTPAACTATLTTALSSLYPPPTNQPEIPAIPLVLLALGLILFLGLVRWVPENRRRAYAYAGLVAFALLGGVIAGCGGGGGSSGGGGGGGGGSTRTIKATYSGDTNYSTSNGSTSIQIQ